MKFYTVEFSLVRGQLPFSTKILLSARQMEHNLNKV